MEKDQKQQKCKEGYRWCPIRKRCVPEDDVRGKGSGLGRGQGEGPIGVPPKLREAWDLVDLYLSGKTDVLKSFKKVDDLLENIKNSSETKLSEGRKEEYRKIFMDLLSQYGVKSPKELSKDQKKEFFNKLDKAWKAKKETD